MENQIQFLDFRNQRTCRTGVPDPPFSSSSSSSSSLSSLLSLSISEASVLVFFGTNARLFPETLDILNIPMEFQEAFSA